MVNRGEEVSRSIRYMARRKREYNKVAKAKKRDGKL